MLVKIKLSPDYRAPAGKKVTQSVISMNFDINFQMKSNIYNKQ